MKGVECIQKVEALLREIEMPCYRVGLGFVDFPDVVAPGKIKEFERSREQYLYEVRKGEKEKLVYLIKKNLIEKIHSEEKINLKLLPDYVKTNVYTNYRKLNRVFREAEGISIKQFTILYSIERAKELIDTKALNV